MRKKLSEPRYLSILAPGTKDSGVRLTMCCPSLVSDCNKMETVNFGQKLAEQSNDASQTSTLTTYV